MTVFSIIVEILARLNLIVENYGYHFVFIVIYLGTTEFLLRSKKPHVLILQWGHILKLLFSGGTMYHSSGYFKEKLNITVKPLKSSFTSKVSPYIQWCVSPLLYFFTTTASFGDNKKDESDDDESNPDESKDDEMEINVDETSDQSGSEEKATDSTEIYIDLATELSEQTSSKTPHKRKAVIEEKKDAKRPRSSNVHAETSSFENTLFSNLEMEAKSNDKEQSNLTLPNQSDSNNTENKMSLISIPDFNETTPIQLTHDEIEHPQNSETAIVNKQHASQVSQGSLTRDENPCGNKSFFPVEGYDKSSCTLETSRQSSSPDNTFQELVSSSNVAQDCEILPSELFPGDKTCIPGSHAHKKFRRSQFIHASYQSRSEDTCQIESQDSVCFDAPSTSESTFQHTDNRLQQDLISNKDVTEEISSKSIKCDSKKNPIATSSSCLIDSSSSTDEHVRTCNSDIKSIHHQGYVLTVSKICDNLPQNIAETVPPTLSTSVCTSEYGQKACEVSINKSRHDNIVATTGHQNSPDSAMHPWDRPGCSKDPEYYPHIQIENSKGSESVETYKNAGSSTMESTTRHRNSPDSAMHLWDRPGCSKDPEYYPHIQIENNNGSKSVEYCRSYPGLALQPLKVKKDAFYQKKFYKQKKEIVLPIKMAKIIRWAEQISENVAHNVTTISDSGEDKLSLDRYHELAQELVEGFLNAYKSTKEKALENVRDKKSAERKRQNQKSRKINYVASSFQEESPSSEISDEDISVLSQKDQNISVRENLRGDNNQQINEWGLPRQELIRAGSPIVIDLTGPETDYSYNTPLQPLCQDEGKQSSAMNVIPGYFYKNITQVKPFAEASTGTLDEREFTYDKSINIEQSKIWKPPGANRFPDEIAKGFGLKSTIQEEQIGISESLKKFLWETARKIMCPESSGSQQIDTFGSPHVSSISQETVNTQQLREFENEQRAIWESLSASSGKKSFGSDSKGVSLDNEREISKSSFTDISDDEQRAMMESLISMKQPEDLGYQLGTTEYAIPPELNIYKDRIFSDGKSTYESSTYREDKSSIEEGGPSTSTEIFSRDENIDNSFIPAPQTEFRNENIFPSSGSTPFPIIINVRHKSSSESENEETSSPL